VVHIPDILTDPEYRWAKDHHGEEEMHRTILAVPMLREDKIVGVIVASPPKPSSLSRMRGCLMNCASALMS
jgi:GAF domain-containing protein